MFAVIATGGKQYKVVVGQTINVEKLAASVGNDIDLSEILLLAEGETVTHGAPHVAGASVTARVVSHGKAQKIIVFRYRAKSRYRRKNGHRQSLTTLLIKSINAPQAS